MKHLSKLLLTCLSVACVTPVLQARLTEEFIQLNNNIENYTPVYSENDFISLFSTDIIEGLGELTTAPHKKEVPGLLMSLQSPQLLSPTPAPSLGKKFLGFSNPETKLNLMLHGPNAYRQLAQIPLAEGTYEFNFSVKPEEFPAKAGLTRPQKFTAKISLNKKKLPIKVADSRSVWRSYKAGNTYWVSVVVAPSKR